MSSILLAFPLGPGAVRWHNPNCKVQKEAHTTTVWASYFNVTAFDPRSGVFRILLFLLAPRRLGEYVNCEVDCMLQLLRADDDEGCCVDEG